MPHLTQTAFCQQNLLLQFILLKVIAAKEEIDQISSFLESSSLSKKREDFPRLIEHCINLMGFDAFFFPLSSWTEEGLLNKLNNYCHSFCQDHPHIEQKRSIYSKAIQALTFAKQAAKALNYSHSEKEINIIRFKQAMQKLKRTLEKMNALLEELLLHCQEDENLMFFIIKNHHEIDSIYKSGTSLKWVYAMLPADASLKQFLVQRYSERNLSNLLPLIEEKVAEIQNVH